MGAKDIRQSEGYDYPTKILENETRINTASVIMIANSMEQWFSTYNP
jgi:hypothetical protein